MRCYFSSGKLLFHSASSLFLQDDWLLPNALGPKGKILRCQSHQEKQRIEFMNLSIGKKRLFIQNFPSQWPIYRPNLWQFWSLKIYRHSWATWNLTIVRFWSSKMVKCMVRRQCESSSFSIYCYLRPILGHFQLLTRMNTEANGGPTTTHWVWAIWLFRTPCS